MFKKNHFSNKNLQKTLFSRVPNALQGREKPDLNIFAMQGVPRYLIDERILAGATNYWAKVKAEQSQKPKKEKEKKPNAKKEKASGKERDENSMKNQGFPNTFIIFSY